MSEEQIKISANIKNIVLTLILNCKEPTIIADQILILSKLYDSILNMESDLNQHKNIIESLNYKICTLEHEKRFIDVSLNNSIIEINKLKEENANLQKINEENEKLQKINDTVLQKLNDENEDILQKLKEENANLQKLNGENADILQKLKEENANLQKLKEENANLQKLNDEKDLRIIELSNANKNEAEQSK
jgi:chromosome segregation ATPase